MVRVGGATQEEYEEWLGRLEETEPLPDELGLFQEALREELSGYDVEKQDRMIEALWDVKKTQTSYSEHGIRAVIVRYPWGSEIRYGVEGMAGLWGWESVQAIREGEGW